MAGTPTSPASGPAPAARCDSITTPCPSAAEECPTVEIEINNTPDAKDDLVQIKCEHPAKRHKVPCRIRATGGGGAGSATIVLTNPDGRLRFPNDGDTTTNLTVPKDGTWVAFEISGEKASAALEDAIIQAHCNTAAGPLKGTKQVTVFWFDQAEINIATPGHYVMVGNTLTATGGHTVDHSAKARIRPAGVDCTAPQVRDLRIGIMQNDATSGLASEIVFSNPVIAWNPGVAAGTVVRAIATIAKQSFIPTTVNDSEPSVAPLYDQPGKAGTLDDNSLMPPMGCTGGGTATTFDTPESSGDATMQLPAISTVGAVVGSLTYTRTNIRIIASFLTWTVSFDTVKIEHDVLRQRTWALNVQSATRGTQKATKDAADIEPDRDPILAPLANTAVSDPANQRTSNAGSIDFTK